MQRRSWFPSRFHMVMFWIVATGFALAAVFVIGFLTTDWGKFWG